MARRDSCEGCGKPLKRDEHGLCEDCAKDDDE